MIYTSYYAVQKKLPEDVVCISISRGIPSWYHGKSYNKLAPLWDTVKRYKNGGLWTWYIEEYYDTVLNKLDPQEVYKDLMEISGGKDVVLLCYEKSGDNCHRHLVAGWFEKAGIKCVEYKFLNAA